MIDKNACPKCNRILAHVPDNLHFHYWCRKCDREYDLDGITVWKVEVKRRKRNG